ncbi:hypothetical protein B0H10DRAFT_334775 [Mycena sp. CBHHK59/15]|nr:hypothetical protein B0H10DRAFT_334775 [Mycena sp. CBHHK59/15]
MGRRREPGRVECRSRGASSWVASLAAGRRYQDLRLVVRREDAYVPVMPRLPARLNPSACLRDQPDRSLSKRRLGFTPDYTIPMSPPCAQAGDAGESRGRGASCAASTAAERSAPSRIRPHVHSAADEQGAQRQSSPRRQSALATSRSSTSYSPAKNDTMEKSSMRASYFSPRISMSETQLSQKMPSLRRRLSTDRFRRPTGGPALIYDSSSSV